MDGLLKEHVSNVILQDITTMIGLALPEMLTLFCLFYLFIFILCFAKKKYSTNQCSESSNDNDMILTSPLAA